MSKIAVFGGAFNPVHNGHIRLAQTLKDTVQVDKVLLIPTNQSPHKQAANLASGAHRLNMCRLASEKHTYIEVCDLEIKKGGVSYTAKTLEILKETYPIDDLYFICGADMFITLENWREPDVIFKNAIICTVPRNDIGIKELLIAAKRYEKRGARCIMVPMEPFSSSSSEIREMILKDLDVSGLISTKVLNYILENGIYKDDKINE